MILDRLVPEPYRLLAKLGSVFVLGAAIGSSVLWYGSQRYDAGADAEQAKWKAADLMRERAEADARAKRAVEIVATVQTQTEINQKTETAHAETTTALRDLYGPGRVRQQSARTERSGAAVRAAAPGAGESHAGTANVGSGADEPAAPADCEGLKSDAAVTTEQLLRLQQWAMDQGVSSGR